MSTNDNMTEIQFDCSVRFVQHHNVFTAECRDYGLVAEGKDENEAAESLFEAFVQAYCQYRLKGLDMPKEKRDAPEEPRIKLFEVWRTVVTNRGLDTRIMMSVYTTSESIVSQLRSNGGLWSIVKFLPGDYSQYGGEVERDELEDFAADCTSCRWFRRLHDDDTDDADTDWGVCTNPKGHRAGLLTWEHQGCLLSEVSDVPKVHYHRNGISGVGFQCSMQGRDLWVKFSGRNPVVVTVPAPEAWQDRPSQRDERDLVPVSQEPQPNCTVHLYWRQWSGEWFRFIGIELDDDDSYFCFAAFDADVLPDLTFGVNSWRGDQEWEALQRALKTP